MHSETPGRNISVLKEHLLQAESLLARVEQLEKLLNAAYSNQKLALPNFNNISTSLISEIEIFNKKVNVNIQTDLGLIKSYIEFRSLRESSKSSRDKIPKIQSDISTLEKELADIQHEISETNPERFHELKATLSSLEKQRTAVELEVNDARSIIERNDKTKTELTLEIEQLKEVDDLADKYRRAESSIFKCLDTLRGTCFG